VKEGAEEFATIPKSTAFVIVEVAFDFVVTNCQRPRDSIANREKLRYKKFVIVPGGLEVVVGTIEELVVGRGVTVGFTGAAAA